MFRIRSFAQLLKTSLTSLFVSALATVPAFAAGSNMPWEAPLESILESIQGRSRGSSQ